MAREENANRFEPVQALKGEKSTTKRVALFIFIAAGALFTLVAFAIINSGGDNLASSRPPEEVIEPSRASMTLLPPPPSQPKPESEPKVPFAEENEEPEQQPQQPTVQPAPQPQTQVQQPAQPTYVPAPRASRARTVTDRRRENQAARLQAASAPTAIQGFGRQTEAQAGALPNLQGAAGGTYPGSTPIGADMANGVTGAVQDNASGLMPGMESGSDANGWARKEAFRNQPLPAEYSQHTRVFPVSAYELKAGSILPCVLISGLNSDLPGNLIGQVSENVWDTATGRLLLIPRGSRLIGTYDHQINYGQNRALVIWSRIIFPDGSSLLLDNLQGADQAGYSGFKQRVDRHWGNLITSALLVSLMGAGVELATNNNKNNNNNSNNSRKSAGDILSERVATAIAEAMTQIITKGINRQPTILIKPGYRFSILVQHDIVFPRAWSAAVGR
ncbi:MAG: TrbI/VirB10 family protein [Synergistaceae bacterium]|nr:TrbI/VirB10 family protein [Synergistaceae bacterium]